MIKQFATNFKYKMINYDSDNFLAMVTTSEDSDDNDNEDDSDDRGDNVLKICKKKLRKI